MAYRPKDTQERIAHRLKIARGHLEKVISMVENDSYCIDVLHQLQAVEGALKETGNAVLTYSRIIAFKILFCRGEIFIFIN